jgi:long-chain acyl-CoA synthetase
MNAGVNVIPASRGLDEAEFFALAAHWRNASCFAAPTIVRRLAEFVRRTGTAVDGLATLVYGGAPMYVADLEMARQALGPHLAQIYGQGESPMTISVLPKAVIEDRAHPRWRERMASVGVAQPMVDISIRAPDGSVLPTGDVGEVCVRGEVVMPGYWQQPEASASTLRDGWLWTGDVGRLDDEGFLTLLDRSKDLVISGGNNIYPREVEEVLLTHPAVAEVSVIGRPDPEWGESLVAFIVRQGDVQAADLDAHCLAHIARYKRPKAYRFVEALPKNNYGKVLKTELRKIEAAGSTPQA